MKKNSIIVRGLSVFLVSSSIFSFTVVAAEKESFKICKEGVSYNQDIIVDKIKNLNTYGKTSTTITLSWNEPDNVYGLSEYVIYKNGKELDTVKYGKNGYTVTGLSFNKVYGFKVSARYSNGVESKPISINSRTDKEDKDIIISKPKNIASSDITENSFKLGWEDPENIYGLIEHVIYIDGKEFEVVPAGTNKYKIDGLRKNTIYGVKVTARYLNGEESKPISINLRTKK